LEPTAKSSKLKRLNLMGQKILMTKNKTPKRILQSVKTSELGLQLWKKQKAMT